MRQRVMTKLAPAVPGVLVWSAGVSWDGIPGTDRRLAAAMTRYAPVLWVDPAVSSLTPAKLRGNVGRTPTPTLSQVGDRITRLTPVALPGLGRPGIRITTPVLVRAQIRWALRRLGARPFGVVATHLEEVLGRWGEDVVDVLYGTDDYVAGAKLLGLSARRLSRQEGTALARADVTGVVSPALADRWAALGARPVMQPNGCDAIPTVEPATIPDGLARPVAGVIGQLSERIDMAALEAIADLGLSLLLVGPHDPRWEPERFAALIARSTVHHTGPVESAAVPSYLAAIDVGLTPYTDSAFNRASFPLKTLEYLAAGRPVVSTDLPASRWLEEDLAASGVPERSRPLTLVGDSDSFAAAVMRAATASTAADLPARCRSFAARHSWDRRAESFAHEIGLVSKPDQLRTGAPTRVDCAVLVVTYNSVDVMPGLLDSLPAAADGLSLRTVVVDNGSIDGTVEMLRGRPDLKLIEAPENPGYAGGINLARRHAGPCASLLVLNPDLSLAPGAIRELTAALSDEAVGVAVPKILGPNGDLQLSLRREPSLARALGDALFGRRLERRPGWLSEMVRDQDQYELQHEIDWATGAVALISARCDAAVGPWDERFFMYSEEVDHAARVRAAGLRVEYVPRAVANHRAGGSGSSDALTALMAVNRVRYVAKRGRGAAAFRTVVALHELLRAADPAHRLALRAVLRRSRWAALPGGHRLLLHSSGPAR